MERLFFMGKGQISHSSAFDSGLKCIGFTPTLLMCNVVMQMGKIYTRCDNIFLSFVTESYKQYLYGNIVFRKAFRNEIVL